MYTWHNVHTDLWLNQTPAQSWSFGQATTVHCNKVISKIWILQPCFFCIKHLNSSSLSLLLKKKPACCRQQPNKKLMTLDNHSFITTNYPVYLWLSVSSCNLHSLAIEKRLKINAHQNQFCTAYLTKRPYASAPPSFQDEWDTIFLATVHFTVSALSQI